MGTPVPDEWPELIDDKYYCIHHNDYYLLLPYPLCEAAFVANYHCCRTGQHIKDWYEDVGDCVWGRTPCFITPGEGARITGIEGPYDTKDECDAVCT